MASDKPVGGVAQLGERCVRNAEVGSSILLFSTTPHHKHHIFGIPPTVSLSVYFSVRHPVGVANISVVELAQSG